VVAYGDGGHGDKRDLVDTKADRHPARGTGKAGYLEETSGADEQGINAFMKSSDGPAILFKKRYARCVQGDDPNWRKNQKSRFEGAKTYRWNMSRTYVQNPPYSEGMKERAGANSRRRSTRRILAIVRRQKITTDHISAAGARIKG